MRKVTKSELHAEYALCVRFVNSRRMPIESYDPLLWEVGEPQRWGDPPGYLPVVVENDFILGDAPWRFPCNLEMSGEGYLLKPEAKIAPRQDPIVAAFDETGAEFYIGPQGTKEDLGTLATVLMDRVIYVNLYVRHNSILHAGVALRRPGWELFLSGMRFSQAEQRELLPRLVAAWRDLDADPGRVLRALPAEAAVWLQQGLNRRGAS